jgi:hypothetical protein
MAMKKGSVPIEQANEYMVCVEIEGRTPLLQNCFDQKAIEQMLRKHMGLTTTKEAKVPAQCVERATIRNEKGQVCIHSTALKKAMLSASTLKKGLPKTKLRQQIFVEGNSIPITYREMVPQMDMVRTAGIGRTPDVRFRPRFDDWKARFVLSYAESIAPETVVDLVNRAGRVGVGEWRPEKDGTNGTFHVSRVISDDKELREVLALCRPYVKRLTIPEWAMNAEISAEMLEKIGADYHETAEGRGAEGEENEDA